MPRSACRSARTRAPSARGEVSDIGGNLPEAETGRCFGAIEGSSSSEIAKRSPRDRTKVEPAERKPRPATLVPAAPRSATSVRRIGTKPASSRSGLSILQPAGIPMYHHVKKLMFTVRVDEPDPRFGNMLLEQFGGANGELAAAMQYSIQGLNCDDAERKDLLMDIGTEELSHLELIGEMAGLHIIPT